MSSSFVWTVFFLFVLLKICYKQVDRLEAAPPWKGNRTRLRIKPTALLKSIPRPARLRTLHPSLFP